MKVGKVVKFFLVGYEAYQNRINRGYEAYQNRINKRVGE